MSTTLIATVSQKRDVFTIESTVSVYQQNADRSYTPVAHIHDFADPSDHRKTKIQFSEGTLYFHAVYDGPLREQYSWGFTNENNRDAGISLHEFPCAGKTYICSCDGFFPVTKANHQGLFELNIFQPPSAAWGGSLLCKGLATVKQIKKFESGYEYIIQVAEHIPASLLMAIISLPFTLNIDQ